MQRALICIIGVVGALLVGRSALQYRTDWVALTLVTLIGLGLLVGIVEHWRRQARVERLRAAMSGLPEQCPPGFTPPAVLADWFTAARAGRPAPSPPVSATGYLLGAVIMLGMLGTFLGLVQTMTGARELMHNAPDTAALRSSLATPLSGLVRAFGTSVAGIAASVTLGLSALLVRRQERSIRQYILNYIAQAYAAFTPTGRELHALESVAEAAASLPAAAEALNAAASRLDGVRAQIAESTLQAGATVSAAAEQAGQMASRAATQAARSAADALVTATGALEQRLGEVMAHSEKAATRLAERTSDAAASAIGAHLNTLSDRLNAHADGRKTVEDDHLATVRSTLGESAQIFERRQQAQLAAVADTLAASADAARGQTEHMSARLVAEFTTLAEGLARQAQAQTQALDALVGRLGSTEEMRVQALDARAADQAEAHSAAIGRAVDAMRQQHGRQIEALRAEGEALRARETALAERMAAVEASRGERIAAGQHALLDALRDNADARREAEKNTLAQLTATIAQQTTAARDGLTDLRRAHEQLIDRLAKAEANRLDRLSADEDRRGKALTGAMQAAESRYAAAEQARLHGATAQTDALRDASEEVVRSLQAPVQAILDRLEGASLTLAAAERQRGAELSDRLDAVVGQVQAMASRIDRGETHRASALDSTLSGLAAALAAFDGAAVMTRMDALVARLDTQQASVGERLTGAGALVSSGAELLQSGGAELTAVAEMFATAVDSYRQASERSLTALVSVEQAMARQDGEAAGLLREYLDQTREIFGGAMRFQEELFKELRALRSAG
ncbi:MAG: hypothetical protein ACI9U2_000521 [Bradymonadia bacterium]|jgi:hypothetical protein